LVTSLAEWWLSRIRLDEANNKLLHTEGVCFGRTCACESEKIVTNLIIAVAKEPPFPNGADAPFENSRLFGLIQYR
jgi:hypothetical protein